MKIEFIFKSLFIAAVAPETAIYAAVSLQQAYQSALERTESATINHKRINQADAKIDAARSKFLPSLFFNANLQKQYVDEIADSKRLISGAQTSTRFTLTQPIYEGGKNLANFNSARADKRAQEQTLLTSNHAVFATIARTFYSVLSSQHEVQNIRKTSSLATTRVKEIQSRTNIGKSRNVELLAAKTQLSILESQLMAAEGQLVTVKDQFTLLTGLDKDVALVEPAKSIESPKELDTYLNLLEKRPDIATIKANIESASHNVIDARGGHLPSINANGSYYLNREGSQKDNKWDVGLSLVIPIFSGGSVNAQVRELVEKQKELELLLNQTRRQAEISIRNAYNELVSDLKQIKALESALSSTEQNYKEQETNYRFGQATNLDVIQALNLYLDTKRSLDRTHFQALIAWAELNAATANVP